jgi:SAM-dependent methyltransferase
LVLEGLDVPEGGFDVIYSSGVLHHLANPQVGLNNLTKILAPHGVISLILYGSFGRQALYRLIEGIDILCPREASIESRIPLGRLLSKAAEETLFKDTYWKNTYRNPDVEFVDTCLNVNEVSYDISGLWQLIDQANMKFVRWLEPETWSVEKRFNDPELLERLKELSEFDQYQVIERIFEAPKLDFIICGAGNDARERITVAEIEVSIFVVSPETSFFIEKRNQDQSQRIESVGYKVRHRQLQNVTDPILAQLILLLAEQTTSFSGAELVNVLNQSGVDREMANEVIFDLLDDEIIFIP